MTKTPFFSPYFCPICGDDACSFLPGCVIEVCIPCKRKISKKASQVSFDKIHKERIRKYFLDYVQDELFRVSLAPHRFSFFLEYNSSWL